MVDLLELGSGMCSITDIMVTLLLEPDASLMASNH
jgi:hypothetical protein